MAPTTSEKRAEPALAGHDDLKRVLADLDDSRALEILALTPTVAEVEEAALWASGLGNTLDRAGHPLVGNAARIFDILIRDQEEPER
jgi:hypothetical protein